MVQNIQKTKANFLKNLSTKASENISNFAFYRNF